MFRFLGDSHVFPSGKYKVESQLVPPHPPLSPSLILTLLLCVGSGEGEAEPVTTVGVGSLSPCLVSILLLAFVSPSCGAVSDNGKLIIQQQFTPFGTDNVHPIGVRVTYE